MSDDSLPPPTLRCDGVGCEVPPIYECGCTRCLREPDPMDRDHCCEGHCAEVNEQHWRRTDRPAAWMPYGPDDEARLRATARAAEDAVRRITTGHRTVRSGPVDLDTIGAIGMRALVKAWAGRRDAEDRATVDVATSGGSLTLVWTETPHGPIVESRPAWVAAPAADGLMADDGTVRAYTRSTPDRFFPRPWVYLPLSAPGGHQLSLWSWEDLFLPLAAFEERPPEMVLAWLLYQSEAAREARRRGGVEEGGGLNDGG
jgi:hypothetical protein